MFILETTLPMLYTMLKSLIYYSDMFSSSKSFRRGVKKTVIYQTYAQAQV